MKISFIVPVINEENRLPDLLGSLQSAREQGHEVIVVDGGSRDNSLILAQSNADDVLISKPGRAIQMNAGAEVAGGDVFLFLHSDTRLPEDAVPCLLSTLQTDSFWGRFDVRLSGDKFVYRIIEWMMNKRSRLTSIMTGDQAIFISRDLFYRVGGFPEIELMEDIAISRLLKNRMPPVCLKQKVTTSSRRWKENGVVNTVLLMWRLRLYYFFGVSPVRLNRLYRE